MVQKFIQIYQEDGIFKPGTFSNNLAEHFARGLTTILPLHTNIKFIWQDNQKFFKQTYDFDDTAIVIQGPIFYDNNYTAETFKLYRSIYPNVPIVISTWKGEANKNFRRECQENSIVLLENEPPKDRGPWNVNMQLKSSFQGVSYVKENTTAKFVLKTRTDQRINEFDFLVYFKNLLETFPPKDYKLHKRIILLGNLDETQFPFYYRDYLSFGNVNDILKLYGIPFYSDPGEMSYHFRHKERMLNFRDKVPNRQYSIDYDSKFAKNLNHCKIKRLARKFCFPEMYITKTFYKLNIAPIDESKISETSWKFAAEYLILIDGESILFDFPKYEISRYGVMNSISNHSTFSRWLDLYRNFKIDWV